MSDSSFSFFSAFKNDRFMDWVVIPISLLFIIISGHYGLFFGHTFFVDEDAVLNFYHQEKNKYTNGWRPDVALGLTYFLSDPGLSFSWSLIRWWNELFDDGVVAIQSLTIVLLWLACIIQFIFIRKIVPSLGRNSSLFVSVLIAFSSLRYEFIFLRSNTVQIFTTPLLSLIIYDFFKQPRLRHYFSYTAVIFSIAFLGSAISLFQMFVFIAIFFFALVFYNGWHKSSQELWSAFNRFLILNFTAGVLLFCLGGWFFYGAAFEHIVMGYVRDPDYSTKNFFVSDSPVNMFLHFFKYLHSGLISQWSGVLGLEQKLNIRSWSNFSPLFPFIFLVVLFWKSETFWEYAAKFVILVSFLFHEVIYWFPGLFTLVQAVFKFYPPDKLYPSIQVYQILVFAFFLDRLQSGNFDLSSWSQRTMRWLSVLLVPVYLGLFIFAVTSVIAPEIFTSMLLDILGSFVLSVPSLGDSSLVHILVKENIKLFNETIGWPSVLFYGSTAFLLLWVFLVERKNLLSQKKNTVIAVVFFNALFLAWGIYPLNKDTQVWDRQKVGGEQLSSILEPTDRIARVGLPPCTGRSDYNQCIQKKFFDEEFGPHRYVVGYRRMPVLEFSGTRSFTPRHVAEFLKNFMRKENNDTPGILRALQMEPPIFDSRVYDISAVNFLLSRNRLPETEHLELVHKNKQFYLYRNNRAWPYYFLADRIDTIGGYEDLYNAEKGVAYLWRGDKQITLPPKPSNHVSSLELEKFEYGDVKFKYSSDAPEFLVVADSWHPNWHASVNGKSIPIVRTNGVFKGALLPPGDGTVHLFFDNAPYKLGIWISVISWTLFLFGWWCAFRLSTRY